MIFLVKSYYLDLFLAPRSISRLCALSTLHHQHLFFYRMNIPSHIKHLFDRWRYKKVAPFHFTDDISIQSSMEKHPQEVSIVKHKKCKYCGGTLVRLFVDPYASDVIYCREPDAGFLIICTKCGKRLSFEKTKTFIK